MSTPKLTHAMIEAAIAGFELQKVQIDSQIADLRAMLTGQVSSAAPAAQGSPKKKGKFSAETLKRMREAQQRRWAKIKGEQSAPAKTKASKAAAKPRRKLSAAGRKNIIDALKRRYAAKKAANEAAAKSAKKAS